MLNFSDLLVLVSVTLSHPFTPTTYLQYVYLDFNLNVSIPWRCFTCLGGLTGNSFFIYVHAGRGWQHRVALLNLSSWYLVMVERLFLVVPWGCLQLVIVVFSDHTHLLFLIITSVRTE